MSQSAFRAAAFAFAASLSALAHGAESLAGTYALPDGHPEVSAVLAATPNRGGAEMLDIALVVFGQQCPVLGDAMPFPLRPGARLAPGLTPHVLAHKAGTYLL